MKETYPVYLTDAVAGSVQVSKMGLYFRIQCQCSLTDNRRYRLMLYAADRETDLGVYAATGNGIQTQIPMKQAGEPPYRFCLETDQRFVVLEAAKPFPELAKLEQGRFAMRNGKAGITFYRSSSKPTGQ